MKRIHILGASGSGTTTLAWELAQRMNIPHFDADDYYWVPTNPPFQVKQPVELRQAALLRDLVANESWVVSGSLCSWGDGFVPLFDLMVYLYIPPAIRLARLKARELQRYGDRILPGGDMHDAHQAFMAWAALYDEGDETVRSRLLHEGWVAGLHCEVLRLEEDLTVEERVLRVLKALFR